MKRFKFFSATILFACLFFSCSGNGNTNAGKESLSNASASATSDASSSSGDASFSCKIDGRDFSGNGSDNLANAAFKTNPGILSFDLVTMDKTQKGIPEQFKFVVADHGTTTMHNSNSTDNGDYMASYSPANYNDAFGFENLTVTVTSSDASGIKGTFAGTLDDRQNKKEVPVTDGKFNLPWSTYSKK